MVQSVHPAASPGPLSSLNPFCKLACSLLFGLLVAFGAPALAATSSSLSPAAQAAASKGKSAHEQQDYLGAIGHFQEALRHAPNAPELYFYLGVEESKIPGRELRAIAWLGAYLSLRSDGPGAANVKNNIGKLQGAHRKTLLTVLKDVERTARLAETNDRGPSFRTLARKLAEIGEFTSALQIAANLADLPESQAEAYGWIAAVQLAKADIAAALKTASLSADGQAKDDTYLRIVSAQIAGDHAGALVTIARMHHPMNKDRARLDVARFQIRNGDLSAALKTAESIQDEEMRGMARSDIVRAQVNADDLSGALDTAILISPGTWYGQTVLGLISTAQAKKGDIAGILKTAALQRPEYRSNLLFDIAKVQAEVGDLAGALHTVALIEKGVKDHYARVMVQVAFARGQLLRGDDAGVRKTLAAARQSVGPVADAGQKGPALHEIALIQAESGDVVGAIALAGQIESTSWHVETHRDIAVVQAKRGDVAGALKTVDLIRSSDDDKGIAHSRVAEVQATAGDFAGALRTADLIRSVYTKASAQIVVAEQQIKRGDLAGAQKTVDLIGDETSRDRAQEVVNAALIKAGDFVALWRQRLEDSNPDHDGPLNTAPFLDLSKHLQSLPTEDPVKYFGALYRTFIDLIDGDRAINELLEKQGLNGRVGGL
jgi:tetratricopeptide (TPR) repeat protein